MNISVLKFGCLSYCMKASSLLLDANWFCKSIVGNTPQRFHNHHNRNDKMSASSYDGSVLCSHNDVVNNNGMTPIRKQRKVNESSSNGGENSAEENNCHQIRALIITHIDKLVEPWRGSIPFCCFEFSGNENKLPTIFAGNP